MAQSLYLCRCTVRRDARCEFKECLLLSRRAFSDYFTQVKPFLLFNFTSVSLHWGSMMSSKLATDTSIQLERFAGTISGSVQSSVIDSAYVVVARYLDQINGNEANGNRTKTARAPRLRSQPSEASLVQSRRIVGLAHAQLSGDASATERLIPASIAMVMEEHESSVKANHRSSVVPPCDYVAMTPAAPLRNVAILRRSAWGSALSGIASPALAVLGLR